MKNLLKFTVLFLLFTVVFTSCNKDEEEAINYNLESDYFTIENATYMKETFPEISSTAPVIENIAGNPSILAGGSNPIQLRSNAEIAHVFVGVKDVAGYLKLPINSEEIFSFLILMNQNITATNFDIKVAVQDTSGNVSEVSYITVSLIQAGTGRLQVSCSWNQLNDVDLHLIEPNQEEIYYGNGISTSGGDLDVDSNADCSIDNINNENITYGDTAVIQSGEYIVNVDLYANCNIDDTTNYNITAYYEGELITPTFGTNPYNGSFEATDADGGGAGDGETVLKFVIPATLAKSYGSEKTVLKFNYATDKPKRKVLSPQKL